MELDEKLENMIMFPKIKPIQEARYTKEEIEKGMAALDEELIGSL